MAHYFRSRVSKRQCYHFSVNRTGYVLVGGRSSRMGRDKALLPVEGGVLVQQVAARTAAAAGAATLVGDPQRYSGLGFDVIPDVRPGLGPLSGIHAALRHTTKDWNLVIACDMPGVSAAFLAELLDAAEASGGDALVPRGPDGRIEPVCAAYRRRALATVESALDSGLRKATDLLEILTVTWWPVERIGHLRNVNTPEDWAGYAAG